MNYTNGEFIDSDNHFSSFNPSNGAVIGRIAIASTKDVTSAVDAARKSQRPWREMSRIQRADIFDKLCQLIKERTDELTGLISLETGKSFNESRAEVIEALHMVQYCFGKGREPIGQVIASEIPDRDSYILRKPKGVIAVIPAWNFPFAVPFWNCGPSLLEGNTVVFKPSELTPLVGSAIAKLHHDAGFPPGVFNLVNGDGTVGEHLVKSDVDHIVFTGSAEVGMSIRKHCAETWHKTCGCEMGSKSACVVFSDANRELAVNASLNSAFKLSGQRCVSSGRILVQRNIVLDFAEQFVEQVKKSFVCDPLDITPSTIDKRNKASVHFGPMISAEQRSKVIAFNDMVRKDKNATVLYDGGMPNGVGFFLNPFVYQVEWGNKPYLKQEVFGPHVAIIPFDDVDEAIEIYNDTEYGLALGILTDDFRKARKMRDNCNFGMGYWNGGSIAAESHFPFGGTGKSSNGQPSAAGTFDCVVHKVTWAVNHGVTLSFPQGMK